MAICAGWLNVVFTWPVGRLNVIFTWPVGRWNVIFTWPVDRWNVIFTCPVECHIHLPGGTSYLLARWNVIFTSPVECHIHLPGGRLNVIFTCPAVRYKRFNLCRPGICPSVQVWFSTLYWHHISCQSKSHLLQFDKNLSGLSKPNFLFGIVILNIFHSVSKKCFWMEDYNACQSINQSISQGVNKTKQTTFSKNLS